MNEMKYNERRLCFAQKRSVDLNIYLAFSSKLSEFYYYYIQNKRNLFIPNIMVELREIICE